MIKELLSLDIRSSKDCCCSLKWRKETPWFSRQDRKFWNLFDPYHWMNCVWKKKQPPRKSNEAKDVILSKIGAIDQLC